MSLTSRILVVIQFICLIYFAFFANLITPGILLLVQLMGMSLGLWAIVVMRFGNFNIQPEVKKNAVFIKTGPYRLIRNPMYSGLIFFIGPAVIYDSNTWDIIVFVIFIIVLLLKIIQEEKFLEERFGPIYLDYKKNTKRLIPLIF